MTPHSRLAARPVADPRAVVQGDGYRFTVLTNGLVRMEHVEDGRFEDRASTFATTRELPVPDFRVVDTGRRRGSHGDRLSTDREPDQQIHRRLAGQAHGELLAVVAQTRGSTGLARCAE